MSSASAAAACRTWCPPLACRAQGPACAWADAGSIIPWTVYQFFGDTALLREQYDNMKLWVEWIHRVDHEHGRPSPVAGGLPLCRLAGAGRGLPGLLHGRHRSRFHRLGLLSVLHAPDAQGRRHPGLRARRCALRRPGAGDSCRHPPNLPRPQGRADRQHPDGAHPVAVPGANARVRHAHPQGRAGSPV